MRDVWDKDEKAWEEFKKQHGIKDCPVCKMPSEKLNGCNFLYCSSQKCKGKTNFCNLCGDQLTEEDHFSHFNKSGPFGDTCNTLDGLVNKPKPPKPIENLEVVGNIGARGRAKPRGQIPKPRRRNAKR